MSPIGVEQETEETEIKGKRFSFAASQVQDTWKYSDAAVVGSAIVAEIARLTLIMDENSDEFIEKIGAFAANLLPE